MRIEKGDLGEDGLEPRSGFGLFAADFADLGVLVLRSSLGLSRSSEPEDFRTASAIVVRQRKLGVDGLLVKNPILAQLPGLGLALGL